MRPRGAAPCGPQPASLQPQRGPALGQGAASATVALGADLVHGGAADVQLVVELVQAVSQVMDRARTQGTAWPPVLVDGVLGPLGSDAEVSAGGEGEEGENINPRSAFLNRTLLADRVPDELVYFNVPVFDRTYSFEMSPLRGRRNESNSAFCGMIHKIVWYAVCTWNAESACP